MNRAISPSTLGLYGSESSTWWESLRSVPEIKQATLDAQKTDPSGSVLLAHELRGIKREATPALLRRLAVVEHPMKAWALHVELNARDVPPCLRPATPAWSRQADFLATLADLHWLVTRHPQNVTKYERHQSVFRYPVNDDRWHRAVMWAYTQCRGQRHTLAARLGLTDAMRCHTLTMPTAKQSSDRRTLQKHLPALRDAMIDHAKEHPDKSRQTTPDGLAQRRMLLLTTYVRLGRSQTETVNCLERIADITMSRQTLARQLQAATLTPTASRMVCGSS